MGGGGKGDFYARVRVVLPERLSAQERTLFEQLRQLRGRAPAASTG
jgi:DnaJ-class molecular chaperone